MIDFKQNNREVVHFLVESKLLSIAVILLDINSSCKLKLAEIKFTLLKN